MAVRFQSTPPAWGATYNRSRETRQKIISIHAPRMGSDGLYQSHRFRQWHFNPRPPHGERRLLMSIGLTRIIFQSTPPAWGATLRLRLRRNTALLFQSTPPAWGATAMTLFINGFIIFQSTPPAWGATTFHVKHSFHHLISIHAPRMGSDPVRS